MPGIVQDIRNSPVGVSENDSCHDHGHSYDKLIDRLMDRTQYSK